MTDGINSRIVIVKILKKIKESRINIDQCFEKELKKINLSIKDKKYIYNVVITTIKNINSIDQILKNFTKSVNKKDVSYFFIISAISQIFILNQKEYAVINSTCEAYKRLNKKKLNFINGLLRNITRNKSSINIDKLNKSLHPIWFKNILKELPTSKRKVIYKSITKRPLINLVFKNNKKLNIVKQKFLETSKNSLALSEFIDLKKISGYNEGLWWVQDFASTIPVKLIPNLKNQNILDMCAAPGGKTFQLLNSGARVTSCDISINRVKLLKENARRLQYNLNIINMDALKILENKFFDTVLIDAPCSSIGTIRKNPEILYRNSGPNFEFYLDLQYKLLEKAKKLLKINGTLIFAVCSFNKKEGVKQIEKFLLKNKNFQINPIIKSESKGFKKLVTKEGFFQSYPDDLNEIGGIDGFFIARLIKKNDNAL